MKKMKTINFQTDKNYKEIQNMVIERIKKEYGLGEIDDINNMTQVDLKRAAVDLRDDNKFMLEIENKLRQMMDESKIKEDLMQFPVNIRILLPTSPFIYVTNALILF